MDRIYLDLDNCLVDSLARSEDEFVVLAEFGVSIDAYKRAGAICLKEIKRFSYELAFDVMKKECPEIKVDYEELLRRMNMLLDDPKYAFPDTNDFLAALVAKGENEIFILTEGDPGFQTPKINSAGLLRYIPAKNVICMSGIPKANNIAESGAARVFFFDDAPRHLDAVKTAKPNIVCIKVRQTPYWEEQKESQLADLSAPDLISTLSFLYP